MLKNKIILITGASSGIGAACARQFAQAGAHLLLCARRIDILDSLVTQLKNQYAIKIYAFKLDVSQREDVQRAITQLPPEWQKIDVLINNAGLAAGLDTLQEGNIDDWEQMIDTNLKGLLYVTRAVLPTMIERNSGYIINIGSIAGHQVYPKGIVYCATKSAVNVLTTGLRMDLYGTKLRVTTIDPGAVETNFSKVRFKGDEERAAQVYTGMEALTPDDVADSILYAVSRPPHVNISEIIMMPTDQASATLIAREKA